MATVTVYPNADGTLGFWTDAGSGTSNLYTNVDEGTASPNDSDLIKCGVINSAIFLLLGDMPSDFDVITAVVVKVRLRRDTSKGDFKSLNNFRLYQSDESTALTDDYVLSSTPTSFTTDSHTFTITGSTSKSNWDGARLKLVTNSGTSGNVQVSAIQVDITYTASAATPIPNKIKSINQTINRVSSF